jgi:hypothetical protein
MRLDGSIPFDSVGDETRPVIIWKTYRDVGSFIKDELDNLYCRYNRDLLQSQRNWIELLVEKNTIASHLEALASKYTIPMTSGRGYSSLPPRKGMMDRFKASGKEKLVLVVVSDHDPEGDDIPISFGNSMVEDFGIDPENLLITKACLTHAQAVELGVHEGQLTEDKNGSRRAAFEAKYPDKRCWELEAIPFDTLRTLVEDTFCGALDMDMFNAEVEIELTERRELSRRKEALQKKLTELEP